MADFPVLKTGAIAQYPADRGTLFSTQVYRFLDGSEQRFPAYGAALHRWLIRLDLLDEGELETLKQFIESVGGRSGSFSFTDPWDGTFYSNCSLEGDSLVAILRGPKRGASEVVVKENR